MARNPCDAVDPPRPVKRQMQTLDAEEVRRLLEVARPAPFYPMFHLAICTGLRRTELMALRWKHADLNLATISVVQTLHRLRSGELIFQEPKTAKSRRLIALTPTSALILRQHREQQELRREALAMPLREEDLIFAQFDGSPINPDFVSQAWRRTAKAVGYQSVRLHDARHTHATLMLKQGVHPKIVSERLGHATVATTLDIYSHVTPSLQGAAALRFDEALSPEAVSDAKNGVTQTVGWQNISKRGNGPRT
ncbi:MAG: site-specific integrase [Dehalococcoidia bacterium]